MSTIVQMQNNHLKVVRNRYGNVYRNYVSMARRQQKHARRIHCDRDLLSEARQQLDETIMLYTDCGSFTQVWNADNHPHNFNLPAISLVVERIQNGNKRCGLTEVLQGAKGVVQWGNEQVEFSPNNRFKRRMTLKVGDNGQITAAIFAARN